MGANSVVVEEPMVVAMHNLHGAASAACGTVGDLGLVEYACLVCASELEAGQPLKHLRRDFGCFGDVSHYVERLEANELAGLVRDRSDRRGLALKVTEKGRLRLALVDEAIASYLIASCDRLSEDALEHLVVRLRLFSRCLAEDRQVSTLFPGLALFALCRYHCCIARESALVGLTPLHAAMLCLLAGTDDMLVPGSFARRLCVPEGILHLQAGYLGEKHLVRGDDAYELTEEGLQRYDGFADRVSVRLKTLLDDLPDEHVALLEDLADYCVYLFA